MKHVIRKTDVLVERARVLGNGVEHRPDAKQRLTDASMCLDTAEHFLKHGNSINPIFWFQHWNDDYTILPPEVQARKILEEQQ